MNLGSTSLGMLLASLRESTALRAKQDIQSIARALGHCAGAIRNGDDAAAIPDRDGYTLLAAEGMLPSFVAADPFFAGFCAVLTNVSDIAAMGGRPQAVVDVLFAGPDHAQTQAVLAGLGAGSELLGVPLVGGHTARSFDRPYLAAAIVGRAQRLITSFDVRPGDHILACIDLRGRYRDETRNFDAISDKTSGPVRAQLGLLPQLAEAGLVHAGKDISMAGLVGTMLMLLETSRCGAKLSLDAVPAPMEADHDPLRWLQAFPSFGYLLAARAENSASVIAACAEHGVDAAVIAQAHAAPTLQVSYGHETVDHWNLTQAPILGF
ncbi:MAG: sll0787 family AIR synthase-like protein [Polyangiales bacterium]